MRAMLACLGVVLAASGAAAQEVDTSGKGAVLCFWQIFQTARNVIDTCYPDQFQSLRAEFSRAIEATNQFIVANSPTPVTREHLEAEVASQAERDRKRLAGPSGPGSESAFCRDARAHWLEPWAAGPVKEPGWMTADMLSVPRKPVMNPCL